MFCYEYFFLKEIITFTGEFEYASIQISLEIVLQTVYTIRKSEKKIILCIQTQLYIFMYLSIHNTLYTYRSKRQTKASNIIEDWHTPCTQNITDLKIEVMFYLLSGMNSWVKLNNLYWCCLICLKFDLFLSHICMVNYIHQLFKIISKSIIILSTIQLLCS